MSEKIIVVLEDSHERVEWLRKAVAPLKVEHYVRVEPFVAAVEHYVRYKQIALVIFDHDLGHYPPAGSGGMYAGPPEANFDTDGRNGAHAAALVVRFEAPALVWSWNTDGRARIATTLDREDKATKILALPFAKTTEFAAAIGRLLREAA